MKPWLVSSHVALSFCIFLFLFPSLCMLHCSCLIVAQKKSFLRCVPCCSRQFEENTNVKLTTDSGWASDVRTR